MIVIGLLVLVVAAMIGGMLIVRNNAATVAKAEKVIDAIKS